MKKNTLAFGTKINCTFAALAAVLALTVGFGFYTAGSLSDSLENATGRTVPKDRTGGNTEHRRSQHGGRPTRPPVLFTYAKDPAEITCFQATLPREFGVVPQGTRRHQATCSLPRKANSWSRTWKRALRSGFPRLCGDGSRLADAGNAGWSRQSSGGEDQAAVVCYRRRLHEICLPFNNRLVEQDRQVGEPIRSHPAAGSCSCW